MMPGKTAGRMPLMAGDPELWQRVKEKCNLSDVPVMNLVCEVCGRAVVLQESEEDMSRFLIVCMWCACQNIPAVLARLNVELNKS